MKALSRFLISAAAALALASPALAADDLQLSLSVVSEGAEQPTFHVGERIPLLVKLTNNGEAPVELYQLVEDRMVVSLDAQLDGGKTFIYEKIHPDPATPRIDWPKAPLGPGESWELVLNLPALQAGTFTFKAHYARPPRKPVTRAGSSWTNSPTPTCPALSSEPLDVAVQPTADGANAVEVRIFTNMGPIRAQLFPADALGTCLNFANLIQAGAEVKGKLRKPFYDGLTFHRVVPGFMIQGGDPNGDGSGGPGYSIPAEFALGSEVPARLKHHPGSLSMARSNHPDSAGSQFFICVGSPSHLDGEYTCFGEVTRGMDVAYTIAGADTTENATGAKEKPLQRCEIREIRLAPVKR